MIFAMGEKQPILFVMLTEQDVNNMRGGRTTFVDQRQLEGKKFEGVILSLHKNNQEAIDLARRFSVRTAEPTPPQPVGGEAKCEGCDGLMPFSSLHSGKCICCWREAALAFKAMVEAAGRGL